MKILVVDDSTSMRQMVEFTLKTGNHDIKCVENGKEALSLANEESFDLVITDVNMPEMNGYELTENLRRHDKYLSTPIIMLTTESDTKAKQTGRAAGATGWLMKPFNPDQLLKVVNRFN